VVERAQIILLAAAGKQDKEIASELRISVQKSARWRARFLELGVAGPEKDAARPGRTPTIPVAVVKRVLRMTTKEKPSNRTQWSQ
jgi:transposase